MLTDKELSAIVQAWGNEPAQRNIVDLCRDVAKAQEDAERERCAKLCEGESLVDAVNCDADHAYNTALIHAAAAIRRA